MNNNIELSIILPTYNEKDNILDVLTELEKHIKVSYEAIVVDDDSPDKTWELVAHYAETHPNVKLLHRTRDRGLTSAINAGLKLAQGRLLMWMDVDLSMPPHRIPALLKAIYDGADVAVGSRYVLGGGDARAVNILLTTQLLLSKVLSILGGWMLGCKFRDWSSGFIVLKREFLAEYDLKGDYGEYFISLIYYLFKTKKANIIEIPYVLTPRIHGESKTATNFLGFFKRGHKYLRVIWQLKHAPVVKA
jgi:Glycosyltransferases involved in cell wall biogenesis